MLSGIVGKIFSTLFASIIGKIDEWFTRQQLAEAESKAEALRAYADSIEATEDLEDSMEKVEEEIEDLYKEGGSYHDKLDALRKASEARRMKKIKEAL